MIGDIEDCVALGDTGPADRARRINTVLPRALRKRKSKTAEGPGEEKPVADSFIPGTQTVYLKTWGCSHNTSDGEYMAGMLSAAGYSITGMHKVLDLQCMRWLFPFYLLPPSLPLPLPESPLSADLWLLNSCTVKGPSEDGLKNAIRKGRELGKPLVISGCVPQGQKNHSDILGLSVVGVSGSLPCH